MNYGTSFSDEIALAFGSAIREAQPANLGHPITRRIDVPITTAGQPGFVYVYGMSAPNPNPENVQEVGVSDFSVAFLSPHLLPDGIKIAGLPIMVKQIGEAYFVTDLNTIPAIEFLFGLREKPQRSINISQLDYGLIKPTAPPSWRVIVSGARYHLNGVVYDVPTMESPDLESYYSGLPGLSNAIRIDVDPVTPALVITEADSFFDLAEHAQAFTNYPREIAEDVFCSGWIRFPYAQQSIGVTDIYYGSEVLNKTSTVPFESSIGKIMTMGGEVMVMDGEVVWSTTI